MVDVRWKDWDGIGLEHCHITDNADGIVMRGVVAGTRDGYYGGSYTVVTDADFKTRIVRASYLQGPRMHVTSDGEGNWYDVIEDKLLPELKGCFDVDIGMTPATNTLPIKRLKLELGESRDISAAYVPLPHQIDGSFLPIRAEQRYTCLEAGRHYRYDGLFRSFSANLEIDGNGIVLDYPDTFRRVLRTE